MQLFLVLKKIHYRIFPVLHSYSKIPSTLCRKNWGGNAKLEEKKEKKPYSFLQFQFLPSRSSPFLLNTKVAGKEKPLLRQKYLLCLPQPGHHEPLTLLKGEGREKSDRRKWGTLWTGAPPPHRVFRIRAAHDAAFFPGVHMSPWYEPAQSLEGQAIIPSSLQHFVANKKLLISPEVQLAIFLS